MTDYVFQNIDISVSGDNLPTGGQKVNDNNDVISGAFKIDSTTFNVTRGVGVKGNPQTNAAFQIHRDITGVGSSSHGYNDGSNFAEDLQAYNTFGSDIQIGDDTQTTEVFNHVNSFQSTNQIDINTATLSNHRAFIAQDVMVSGTVSAQTNFGAIDLLGVRDTPGFGVAGFDVSSVVNNQIGIATTIRHGINPRSAHFAAGSTDAGATLTSGAAPIDCEGPIINRQNTASTSKTTGALIFTLGGMGCAGAGHFDELNVANAIATYNMNSAAGTNLAKLLSTASLTSLTNVFSGTLELGISNTAKLRLLTDRFIPVTDANLNLGDGTHRWIQLFATTTTISTSDERTKTNVQAIPDVVLDAWGDVRSVMFQFKAAVEEKGDNARMHMGHIAQQVQAAFEGRGLDAFKYGLLCEDPQMHKVKKTRMIEVPETKTFIEEVEVPRLINGKLRLIIEKRDPVERPIIKLMPLFDENDKPLMEESIDQYTEKQIKDAKKAKKKLKRKMVQRVCEYTPTKEIEEVYYEEELSGETLMGLRYTECMVLHLAYLQREIVTLKNG